MMPASAPPDPAATEAGRWAALRRHAATPLPVPTAQGRLELVCYGLAQPFLGLRTILRSPDLRRRAVVPVLALAAVVAFVTRVTFVQLGPGAGIMAFLATVVALAPLPPLLLGRIYARLAAEARVELGLRPHAPHDRPMDQLALEWLTQLGLLAMGIAPLIAVAGWLPWAGAGLAVLLQGAWVLYWIVVEALDNARTLDPERAVETAQERPSRPPWFQRWFEQPPGPSWLHIPLLPLYVFGNIAASFAQPWSGEMELAERHPWISLGFGLGAAVMLAVPGLNLLLRPAVIVAGVHLRHRLRDEPAATGSSASAGAGASPVAR